MLDGFSLLLLLLRYWIRAGDLVLRRWPMIVATPAITPRTPSSPTNMIGVPDAE